MKTIIDSFSTNSSNYVKYRTTYPKEFIEEISHHVNYKKSILDIGAGNRASSCCFKYTSLSK